MFSGNTGVDPYTTAVSDVYQDLFDEGSYTGKGIYEVDAFEEALNARVPENTLLSHDLFEGLYARAALVTDIELFDDYPERYDTYARRQHRWTRGDWQVAPWIMGHAVIQRRTNATQFTSADLTLEDIGQLAPEPGCARGHALVSSSLDGITRVSAVLDTFHTAYLCLSGLRACYERVVDSSAWCPVDQPLLEHVG